MLNVHLRFGVVPYQSLVHELFGVGGEDVVVGEEVVDLLGLVGGQHHGLVQVVVVRSQCTYQHNVKYLFLAFFVDG